MAKKIQVLKDGRLIEAGAHESLMQHCVEYAALIPLRLSGIRAVVRRPWPVTTTESQQPVSPVVSSRGNTMWATVNPRTPHVRANGFDGCGLSG